ncbi:MAG: bifunctional nuclease family protein [Syntrophaceae bacterium]|nr:bifunctional nuclease family protein [Syntrophaceae bacterium]
MPRIDDFRMGALGAICLAISVLPAQELPAKPPAPAANASQDAIQVKIQRLILDPSSNQPVVFLTDLQEERALLIWIGPCEANAMNAEMEGTKHPRPQTHDLLQEVIRKMKAKVQRIVITHSKDGIYYANLVLEREGTVVEIDARPSDSMVLAQKTKAPIFVARKMFQEASVPLREEKGVEDQYGLTVQELTSSLAQSFSFKSTRGVLVSDVRAGSPAEKDGLQRGDIISEIGGETIADVKSLKAALGKVKGPVKSKVFRKGEFISLTLQVK